MFPHLVYFIFPIAQQNNFPDNYLDQEKELEKSMRKDTHQHHAARSGFNLLRSRSILTIFSLSNSFNADKLNQAHTHTHTSSCVAQVASSLKFSLHHRSFTRGTTNGSH